MSPTDPTRVPAGASATLATTCWSCGETLEKTVPRRSAVHRHFAWRCASCDVRWTGPGEPAA
jgi:hypothetical protein